VAKPDLVSRPPCGQLEPREGVDRDCIRCHERSHVADGDRGVAALQQRAQALAEGEEISACEGTTKGEDDRARPVHRHLRERPVGRGKLIGTATDEFCSTGRSNPP